ncbi:MAG: hypothetical protein AB7V36_12215 [Bacteroidales bacterium]
MKLFNSKPIWEKMVFIGLIVLTIFISFKWFNYNQKRNTEGDWKGNLWADAGGYYVYLPAFFMYNFNTEKLLEGIDNKVDSAGEILCIGGGGKIIDGKINTKYYIGVAIMQAPVFLTFYAYDAMDGNTGNGFTAPYTKVPIVSAAIYFILSFIFLFKLLRNYVSRNISLIIILTVVFATNAIYYFTAFPGYSHAHSFFLISAFLYFSNKFSKEKKKKQIYLLAIITVFILITRPVNVLVALVFFTENKFADLKSVIKWKDIVAFVLLGVLICLPQFLYYNYLTGSFMTYSYGDEGFTNLSKPFLIEFWFSFCNGLFTYNPIWFLLIFIAIFLSIKRIRIGYFALLTFIVFSYLLASWHAWAFGCGYGSRNFVDFLPLFTVAMAIFYQKFLTKRIIPVVLIAVFIGATTLYNFTLMKNHEKCFFGDHCWDTESFINKNLLK